MFDDVKVSCRHVLQKSPSVNYGFLSVTAFCRSVFAAPPPLKPENMRL
jgi:hypothetical protein